MTKDVDLAKFLTRERHAIHLIGVAGSGMSGIAGLLLQLGHEVSGSDKLDTLETDRLERLGLKFFHEHRAEDARDAELIIYSSAIKPDNPILESGRDNGKACAFEQDHSDLRIRPAKALNTRTAKSRLPSA